jgi:hypothetical protein
MASFWEEFTGGELSQGDLFLDCRVPVIPPNFSDVSETEIGIEQRSLITLTQTCDLVNGKASYVTLCPIYSLPEYLALRPELNTRSKKEELRRGKWEGVLLLSALSSIEDKENAFLVLFREVHSLPIQYLQAKARSESQRYRLKSPYLEYFSRAFGNFIGRVALPFEIPAF